MKYITLQDMNAAIRDNLWKIPRDFDFVLGIPRSGVLAGSIIAEYLNLPLTDLDSFCSGARPTGGARLRYYSPKHADGKKKVLVVDDTVFAGGSKMKARKRLQPFTEDCDFTYLAVFLEGPGDRYIDLYLEDVRKYTDNFSQNVIYEWNIFHHNEDTMLGSIWDLDGVMCVDPPDERTGQEYLDYIRDALPLFVPTPEIGGICSFRLRINEDLTREWLSKNGVRYRRLRLFPADSLEERNATGVTPTQFKADYYKSQTWAKLFIESSDWQAQDIARMTGKPVYCVETNRLY